MKKFQLDLLGEKQKFEEGQSELDRALQLQIAQLPGKSGTGMQKDYSPERIYFESLCIH